METPTSSAMAAIVTALDAVLGWDFVIIASPAASEVSARTLTPRSAFSASVMFRGIEGIDGPLRIVTHCNRLCQQFNDP
ncbi:hypothetical protein GCM10009661_32550 [Catellatospora chokoriensis]|uniref:Uncharacterized protein n=1 Tax=Catellatospora chokoriensis TaxID=310353 RepID=A0A8J3JZL8_9ACTN|nr:hypothetical protein Cch02nite_47780 [Catellatospora chokoriensis]